MKKDVIIFGAGIIGRMALLNYADRVDCFIDNNTDLQGKTISGIKIKSVEAGIKDIGNRMVVIASSFPQMMAYQLDELGVKRYTYFKQDTRAYYETEGLVVNPYLGSTEKARIHNKKCGDVKYRTRKRGEKVE